MKPLIALLALLMQVATPPPVASTINNNGMLTISDAATSTVYYTINGSNPSQKSTIYTAPIPISGTVTVKAIAINTQLQVSPISEYDITAVALPPVFSIASGTYSGTQTLTLTSGTTTADIFYTTVANATPGASSTKYTGPITISANMTVNAIAAQTGYTPSAVVMQSYVITSPETRIAAK
jgi:hypothetical protein